MDDPLVINNIADGIFMLRPKNPMWPSSANVYVVMENCHEDGYDGQFSMIDVGCGKEEAVGLVKDALSSISLSIKNLKTLVLSHAHPDHMGGVGRLLNGATPEILIHEKDFPNAKDPAGLIGTFDIEFAKRCYSDRGGKASVMADLMGFFTDFGCPMFGAIPTGTLIGGDVVKLGNYQFEVMETPGHSPGHISLFDSETKIMYGGDLVGDIVAWYTPASGGVIEYFKSLYKMEAKSPKIILPSHSEAVTNPKETIDKVRERLFARENKMIEILEDGSKTFVELVDLMFKVEMIRFFPGAGITESHIIKLIADGRAQRIGEKVELI